MSGQPSSSHISWSPRQVALATVFVVGVASAFFLLYRFRGVLFILFIAIVLGTATQPLVKKLQNFGLPPLYGELLIYVTLLAALLGFSFTNAPLLLEQGTSLTRQFSGYYDDVRSLLVDSPSNLVRILGYRLPPELNTEDLVEEQTSPPPADPGIPPEEETVSQVASTFRLAGTAIRGLLAVVAVFLMAFYWTLEGGRAIRSILLLLPKNRREEFREVIEEVQVRVGGYIFGLAILSLVVGALALVVYLVIGLPNAFVLALIAGLMEAIPVVGPALGALPAVAVAASTDPVKIIWVLVGTGVIQFLENYILVPRIMGKSVGVNPLLTLLALAALSSLLGVPGALMAIPIAAIVQILIDRFVFRPVEQPSQLPEGRDYLSYLRYQAQEIAMDVRKQVRHKDRDVNESSDQVEDMLESIAMDLDKALSQNTNGESPAR